ncbi:MAG: hypothetical protein ACKPKO_09710, partial [Candidatus Fonsibacter sp.]
MIVSIDSVLALGQLNGPSPAAWEEAADHSVTQLQITECVTPLLPQQAQWAGHEQARALNAIKYQGPARGSLGSVGGSL